MYTVYINTFWVIYIQQCFWSMCVLIELLWSRISIIIMCLSAWLDAILVFTLKLQCLVSCLWLNIISACVDTNYSLVCMINTNSVCIQNTSASLANNCACHGWLTVVELNLLIYTYTYYDDLHWSYSNGQSLCSASDSVYTTLFSGNRASSTPSCWENTLLFVHCLDDLLVDWTQLQWLGGSPDQLQQVQV